MTPQEGAHTPPDRRFIRVFLTFSILLNLVLLAGLVAVWNPLKAGKPRGVLPPPPATATPNPTQSRPAYQYAPSSDTPVDGSQQCPDAGSVIAGKGNDKTQTVVLQGAVAEPVLLLGQNRRVVIAKDAVMVGNITMCGDGGTLLIIGQMGGQVVMRGNGVKIVVQDGGKEKLPPAYSTSNGLVLSCTTKQGQPNTPHCDNYQPRPSAKPKR